MSRMGKAVLVVLFVLMLGLAGPASRAQGVPIFEIDHSHSTIKFYVKASVAIGVRFEKWDATLTFTSPDVTTGVLDIKVQAASVNTGSGMKDGKLKSKDFLTPSNNPLITFNRRRLYRPVPTLFEFDGDFTIRGVTKPETLTLRFTAKGRARAKLKGRWPSIVKTTG